MPHGIFCHGYLTVKGQKISKSMPATRVDPNQIADVLGADPLRYFVLREYSLGADGDFTYESLFQRYESDLGNDLGNLANRTIAMSRQFLGDAELVARAPRAGVDPLEELEVDLRTDAIDAWMNAVRGWEDFAPGRALDATWAMIRAANAYIDRAAPWKLGKAGQLNEVKSVLANAAEVVRRAAMMLAPAMPSAARELLRQIGRENDFGHWPEQDWKGWPGGTFTLPKPVFPRFEAAVRDGFIAKWTAAMGEPVPAPAKPDASGAGATAAAATSEPAAKAEIGIDDFGRVELRAARVLAAERVPKTDKLLKLTLDLGTEQRTVVSGIAGAYQPEAIVGKTVIYLANLKPAKIRGVLSQGMILAAGDDQVLALSALDRDVPPGTKIR
jgi:methionyl-tRNA synthetase